MFFLFPLNLQQVLSPGPIGFYVFRALLISAEVDNKIVLMVPLNESNYSTWKVQCRLGLMKDNLFSLVNETEKMTMQNMLLNATKCLQLLYCPLKLLYYI